MASRMEKYHSASSTNKRSVRNEHLYKDIYQNVEYSNIEGVATMEKTNEISLSQIQELLKEREEVKKKNSTVKRETPIVTRKPVEERNYDIRDVLVKAKVDHVEDDKKNLINTQYNILKNISLKDNKEIQDEIEKTLVNTQVLKNYDDNELSLDMLSDLKSTGNTMVNKTIAKTNTALLLNEIEEAKEKYHVKDNEDGLDKSFYTSSLNFKEDDFEQLKDLQDSIESNNKMIKVLFLLLFLVIAGVVGFVIYKFM